MTATPLIVTSISKTYGKQTVLKDANLTVQANEIFGLIGLNGVGKTTLIKIILSLTTADSGSITLMDKDWQQVTARKQVAYLPEKFQPSRYLKGFEYLALTLSYYDAELDKELAKDYAQKLGLDPTKLSDKVGTYSKGMGQKLGLIGAILSGAKLLILDEPMSGLDPLARIQLKKMLKEQRDAGRSVFFSSHILADIDEICDRLAVIHDGAISFTGSAAEFKTNYNGNTLEETYLDAIGVKLAA